MEEIDLRSLVENIHVVESVGQVKESVESHDITVDVKYTYVCPVTFLLTIAKLARRTS